LAIVELFKVLYEYDFRYNRIKDNEIKIPSCHYVVDDIIIRGELSPLIDNINDIPSPYLTGLCDKFLNDNLLPLIQTTRGCPFTCTFCQAGHSYFNKIRRFSIDRIKDEIEYISKRAAVPELMLADANFGMYKEDIEICKVISSIQKDTGYPKYFHGIEGKSHKDRVIEAASMIKGTYLSAAIQSTNPSVLSKIKRKERINRSND
jgi:radical SAM superfamily enzyme YgiQ (UPF0313 family)